MSSLAATIEVSYNLELTLRERGKVKDKREIHNIFLSLGAAWLAQLMCYSKFSPPQVYRNDRIRYMGVGIGGNRQLALSTANAPPLVGAYPGTNVQTDTDKTVVRLERPVRISGGSTDFPNYIASDVWLGQVQAPPTFLTRKDVQFKRIFGEFEVSYAPYLTVPISEVGLFTAAANPSIYNSEPIAYDVFDSISKTISTELEISWTLRL